MEITTVIPVPVREARVVMLTDPTGHRDAGETYHLDRSHGIYGTETADDAVARIAELWEGIIGPENVSVATLYRASNHLISEIFAEVGTA